MERLGRRGALKAARAARPAPPGTGDATREGGFAVPEWGKAGRGLRQAGLSGTARTVRQRWVRDSRLGMPGDQPLQKEHRGRWSRASCARKGEAGVEGAGQLSAGACPTLPALALYPRT